MSSFLHYLTLPYLLKGITVTLEITFGSIFGGATVGLLLASFHLSRARALSLLARGYTVVARGTPLILQLVFVYDVLPHIGLTLSAVWSAVVALSLNEASFFAEIIRGSIISVDKGQTLAGESLGMRPKVLMRRIIAPQMIRIAVPSLGSECVAALKNSSLASVISAQELTLRSEQLVAQDFAFFSVFFASGVMYLVLTALFSMVQLLVERKLDLDRTEKIPFWKGIFSLSFGRRIPDAPSHSNDEDLLVFNTESGKDEEVQFQGPRFETHYPSNGSRVSLAYSASVRTAGLRSLSKETRIIEGRGLWKSYGNTEVLRNMDFHINRGEIVALLGSSGSGKSTLLRLINHLEDLDDGELLVHGTSIGYGIDGKPLSRKRVADARAKARIGMVFQHFNLFSHLSSLENVAGPLRWVQGIDAEVAKEKAIASLAKVGLEDKLDVLPRFLSGGQQQRVAIARAIATDPEILLLDEPTSALDPELVGEVLQVIRNLTHTGMTMLIVTHELRFARQVADRILFFERGRIVEDGSPDLLLTNPSSDGMRRYLQLFELSDSNF